MVDVAFSGTGFKLILKDVFHDEYNVFNEEGVVVRYDYLKYIITMDILQDRRGGQRVPATAWRTL